jgi:hypothetical protein
MAAALASAALTSLLSEVVQLYPSLLCCAGASAEFVQIQAVDNSLDSVRHESRPGWGLSGRQYSK